MIVERYCELIYIALDGSATHLFRPGLALHMRLPHGKEPPEVRLIVN